MRLAFILPLLLSSAATALAQSPQLLVGEPGKRHPVALAKADVHVLVSGYLARTTMTLTFSNDADRVLEGELVFPLPENASACAYALDVGGQLVDAVTVEKDKARIVYEDEVRRGIDPGIVEKVQGNSFRTRVYPIPAKGTRTVRVAYVSDLATAGSDAAYTLPLKWGGAVADASIKVEVVGSPVAPRVGADGVDGLAFERRGDRHVAERALKRATLATDLAVTLPGFPARTAVVEKRERSTVSVENLGKDAAAPFARVDYYFVATDLPPVPADVVGAKPARVGVAWDASLSRAEADHARELALLEAHLKRLGDVTVDVIPFRNVPDDVRTLRVNGGDTAEVIRHIASLVYDGGTDLSAVPFVREPRGGNDKPLPPVAYYLLFTDGLANLGPQAPARPDTPVFAVADDARADHNLLRHVSAASGGAYVNLQRTTVEQALATLTASPYALLSIDANPDEVAEVYPRLPQPVQGRVTVAGRLLAPAAKLTLNFGVAGRVMHRTTITVSRDAAVDAALASRYWAQLKLAELSLAEGANEAEITALGKSFDLVTPFTSMIVLETVEQYLRHKIVPPKSRAEVYARFVEQVEGHREGARRAEEAKITRVVKMWNDRLAWWDRTFEYAADFKYVAPPEAPRAAAAVTGAVQMDAAIVAERGVTAATPAVPTPAPTLSAADPLVAESRTYGGQAGNPTAGGERRLALRLETDGLRSDADRDGAAGAGGGLFGASAAGGRGFREAAGEGARDDTPATLRRAREPLAERQVPQQDEATIATTRPAYDAPYLKVLRAAPADRAYAVYIEQRKAHGTTPAYFLDAADFFAKAGRADVALRVLTNIPELALDDGRLIRIAAHRLQQLGHLELAIGLFDRVTRLRPEEPQSFRDLALALADRADGYAAKDDLARARSDYERALELLHRVVMNPWARFEEIEVIALMEANRILVRASHDPRGTAVRNPFDPRLVKLLDPDLRIVLTWDTDNTDVDLHVVEPSGEVAYYSHNRTTIGGLVSRDFTQGYGPEEYVLRKLMPGRYQVKAHFYGSRDQELIGPTTVQATIVTNFGRPNEKRQALTLRLSGAKEMIDVGTVTLER